MMSFIHTFKVPFLWSPTVKKYLQQKHSTVYRMCTYAFTRRTSLGYLSYGAVDVDAIKNPIYTFCLLSITHIYKYAVYTTIIK